VLNILCCLLVQTESWMGKDMSFILGLAHQSFNLRLFFLLTHRCLGLPGKVQLRRNLDLTSIMGTPRPTGCRPLRAESFNLPHHQDIASLAGVLEVVTSHPSLPRLFPCPSKSCLPFLPHACTL
jgi:hypothetical protein